MPRDFISRDRKLRNKKSFKSGYSFLKKAKNIWYKDSHFPFMELTDEKLKT